MSDLLNKLVTREPRYQVAESAEFAVRCETKNEDGIQTVEAELANLSRGGARLVSVKPLAVQDVMTVEIRAEGLSQPIQVVATICWTSPAPAGRFWLGCSFRPKIPNRVLSSLAKSGCLDRREHHREAVELNTTAHWELGRCECDVEVVNLSRGGVCFLAEQAARPGERIEFSVPCVEGEEPSVFARALWRVKTEDGFAMGCEFLDRSGYRRLREAAKLQASGRGKQRSLLARLLGR